MRRQILRSMIGITALAILLFALPLGFAAGRLYRNREVTRLEREAASIAGDVPPAGLHGGDQIEVTQRGTLQLAVYDSGNRIAAGRGPARGGSEVAVALRGNIGEDRDGPVLAVALPMHDGETVVGAARAAVPWSEVTHRVWATWLGMFGLGVSVLAVAATLARSQARRLAAPIADVAVVAERLGHGDFSARLDESGMPEIDRAAGALNATAGRLGDLIARERAFSANASHQLGTPLTSLRLTLESALVTPGADREAAIEEAVGEVERLQRTITMLLSVARDTNATGETCDVTALCRDAASRWHGRLAGAGRALRVDIEAVLPPARCSPAALHEILQVLFDNACTHGDGTVTIRARRAGNGVVIELEDEGVGVVGAAEAIFERRSPAAAGHGIGLALARSLAEANEGRLVLGRVRPHPVFTVALVAAAAPVPPGPAGFVIPTGPNLTDLG